MGPSRGEHEPLRAGGAEEAAERLSLFRRGWQTEAGKFDVDVGGEFAVRRHSVERYRDRGGEGPETGVDFSGKPALAQDLHGIGSGVGEMNADNERVVREGGEFVRGDTGDDAADVGVDGGEGERVCERPGMRDVDRTLELVPGQDFAVPLRPLGGGSVGVLRVDAKHIERKYPCATSNKADGLQLL